MDDRVIQLLTLIILLLTLILLTLWVLGFTWWYFYYRKRKNRPKPVTSFEKFVNALNNSDDVIVINRKYSGKWGEFVYNFVGKGEKAAKLARQSEAIHFDWVRNFLILTAFTLLGFYAFRYFRSFATAASSTAGSLSAVAPAVVSLSRAEIYFSVMAGLLGSNYLAQKKLNEYRLQEEDEESFQIARNVTLNYT